MEGESEQKFVSQTKFSSEVIGAAKENEAQNET